MTNFDNFITKCGRTNMPNNTVLVYTLEISL